MLVNNQYPWAPSTKNNNTTPFIKTNEIVKNGIITTSVLDHVRVDRFGEMYLNK